MFQRLLILLLLACCPPAIASGPSHGQSARTMWMLNCQGCHRPDGSGTGSAVPTLPGVVARFLSVPGGREYLIRVPGVATSALSDASLAVLINWMLREFDPENVPANFTPYTEKEITTLRHLGAYGKEAGEVRLALMQLFGSVSPSDR